MKNKLAELIYQNPPQLTELAAYIKDYIEEEINNGQYLEEVISTNTMFNALEAWASINHFRELNQ